jgi:outer membrane protein OmpA-like peptidoglycan-associated protein
VYVVSPPTVANAHVGAIAPPAAARYAAGGHAQRGISLQRSIVPAGLLLLGLLLSGCQPASGPEPGVSPAQPASPAAYPDLASVPPRPRLTYTVEQRREIADELVADREHASYRRAELDYATGRSATPPAPLPPAPPAPAPAAAPEVGPPPGDAAIARQYVETSLNEASDDRDLGDFMKRIDRKIPDPAGPATVVEAVEAVMPGGSAPAAEAQPPASATEPIARVGVDGGEAATPKPGTLERFGSFLGGVLGLESGEAAPATAVAQAAPAPTAPAPPAAPAASAAPSPAVTPPRKPKQAVPILPVGSVVARVPFRERSTTLAPGAETQLARALELARAANTGLRIVAPATDAGLGIDRARTVAVSLMRLGAPAGQLDTRSGGPDSEVVVYLAPRRTS